MLGQEGERQLTKRELAQRRGVDRGAQDAEREAAVKIGLTVFAHARAPQDWPGSNCELSSTSMLRRRASACNTSTVSATGTFSRYSVRVSNDWSTDSIATV